MVVYLAIKNEAYPPVFIAHRLLATGDIDDSQAAEGETDLSATIGTGVVWATMTHGETHGL
jgi:hypothetical protein